MFRVTARMEHAIQAVAQHIAGATAEQKAKFAPLSELRAASDSAITVQELQNLSDLYRALARSSDQKAGSEVDCGRGYVHELALGSAVIPQRPPEEPKQDPEFVKHLEKLRFKAERRAHEELVKNVPGNRKAVAVEDTFGGAYKSLSHEMSIGVNVIAMMGTGYAVSAVSSLSFLTAVAQILWWIGKQYFPADSVMPIMCGLIGLVLALLLEIVLFMMRESARDRMEQKMKASRERLKEGVTAAAASEACSRIAAESKAAR